jgi:hypothetical protein
MSTMYGKCKFMVERYHYLEMLEVPYAPKKNVRTEFLFLDHQGVNQANCFFVRTANIGMYFLEK